MGVGRWGGGGLNTIWSPRLICGDCCRGGRGPGGLWGEGGSLSSRPQFLSPANGTVIKNGSCVAPGDCQKDVYSLTYGPGLSLWIRTACCEDSCSSVTPQGLLAGPWGSHTLVGCRGNLASVSGAAGLIGTRRNSVSSSRKWVCNNLCKNCRQSKADTDRHSMNCSCTYGVIVVRGGLTLNRSPRLFFRLRRGVARRLVKQNKICHSWWWAPV